MIYSLGKETRCMYTGTKNYQELGAPVPHPGSQNTIRTFLSTEPGVSLSTPILPPPQTKGHKATSGVNGYIYFVLVVYRFTHMSKVI